MVRPAAAGKAKAKAKAAPKAKAGPKARAGILRRGGGGAAALVARMRRPAMARARDAAPKDLQSRWESHEKLGSTEVPLENLGVGTKIVVEDGRYFHQECRVAGKIVGVDLRGGDFYMKVQLTGTNHEGILRHHSGAPLTEYKIHRCPQDCNHEEVGDDLIHAFRIRLQKEEAKEEGWIVNLQQSPGVQPEDELSALRKRAEEAEAKAAKKKKEEKSSDSKEKSKKKKKKKKGKKKKSKKKEKDKKADEEASKEKKKKKKEESSTEEEETSTSEDIPKDGSRPRACSWKSPQALFRGTGMDAKEKVRRKVAGRARRQLKKKTSKSSSEDGSGSDEGSQESEILPEDESIFLRSSKVRKVANKCPGALSASTLASMRTSLLSEVGMTDRVGAIKDVALPYFRQHLQRRAAGPASREMVTLAASIDHLVRGQAASALDVLTQRLKSCEATLSGSHWTVSQKLEIVPPESMSLTANQELGNAQKEAYQDAKLKWQSSQADGKSKTSKGQQKGDYQNKGDKKGPDKGRKGGKPPKEDQGKKGGEPNKN